MSRTARAMAPNLRFIVPRLRAIGARTHEELESARRGRSTRPSRRTRGLPPRLHTTAHS